MSLPADRLRDIRARFAEVEGLMARPEVATDPARLAALGREHAALREVVALIGRVEAARRELAGLREMARAERGELAEMAEAEAHALAEQLPVLEAELALALIPKDPEDAKDAILEIRAGTGGDEAALFAGDLLRLYERFAEARGWQTEVLDATPGAQGGYREVTVSVRGPDAYGTLKYESGVHRVQRVPATESQGRIHTSAATVAVLPEAEEVDVELRPQDLKVDVYRSSGPGGQSVNTTDSAVRITHIPSGLVVAIQDEKSQLKNKEKALRVLRSRLYQMELDRRNAERSEARRAMVGSGDRSEKIRTYNFPQNRVTDHRLAGEDKNHPLNEVMGGALEGIIGALRAAEHAERLGTPS